MKILIRVILSDNMTDHRQQQQQNIHNNTLQKCTKRQTYYMPCHRGNVQKMENEIMRRTVKKIRLLSLILCQNKANKRRRRRKNYLHVRELEQKSTIQYKIYILYNNLRTTVLQYSQTSHDIKRNICQEERLKYGTLYAGIAYSIDNPIA